MGEKTYADQVRADLRKGLAERGHSVGYSSVPLMVQHPQTGETVWVSVTDENPMYPEER